MGLFYSKWKCYRECYRECNIVNNNDVTHCCKCKMNYNIFENHCCKCQMNYPEKHCCYCKMNYYKLGEKHCHIHMTKYKDINTCIDCMIHKKVYEYVMVELKYHPRNVAAFLKENDIEDLDNM